MSVTLKHLVALLDRAERQQEKRRKKHKTRCVVCHHKYEGEKCPKCNAKKLT